MRKEEESSEGKFPWLDDTDKRKHDRQRNIRQVHESRQFMFDQDRERAGKRLIVAIQRHVQFKG